jgi:hypothetical protein
MPFGRRSNAPPAQNAGTSGYAGFCLQGYMRPVSPSGGYGPGEDPASRRRQAAGDARLARSMGANLLRVFWTVESVMAGAPEELTIPLNSTLRADLTHRAVFLSSTEQRVERVNRSGAILAQLTAAVAREPDPDTPFHLDFGLLDAVFDGVGDANQDDDGAAAPLRVLLTLVSCPPRWIIEAPGYAMLEYLGVGFSFGSLWDTYVRFHAELYRRLVGRYASDRSDLLCAVEITNEPDYNWTPEEVKIEGSAEALVNPMGKYVTELRLDQVPRTDRTPPPFEPAAWGYQTQDAAWSDDRPGVPVLDFDWGPKFDWYAMCAGQLQSHCARAIKEEAARCGAEVLTVSGSVTHNNIDYLVRMRRGDAHAFDHIDRIGLHPYHWADNDVWNDEFVSADDYRGWGAADPRTYAASYFKRFDFLKALRGRCGDAAHDAEIEAVLGDRRLWLTEFGIASKAMGRFNAISPDLNRLIRPRATVGSSDGQPDVVWEDLWTAFLDQVDTGWLRAQNVECLMLYGLRELPDPWFDLHDDDRSNFALFYGDQSPRLAPESLAGIAALLGSLSDVEPAPTLRDGFIAAAPGLYRGDWRSAKLSSAATTVETMLSLQERQLLHWLTATYYRGEGAIVDGGCFTGGSTIPLAEGLRAGGRDGRLHVYDRFEVEDYMVQQYFRPESLAAGDSFRPVFDRNTAHVADLLTVHEGDLAEQRWSGEPIEILFIDVSKTRELNDLIVEQFFPSLIAGRSIVVQQDLVFAMCPWVAVTMEHLAQYFEPISFVPDCSVAYLLHRELPAAIEPISGLSLERQLALMDRAIARFRGSAQVVLQCAKAILLLDHGESEQAAELQRKVEDQGFRSPAVVAALEQLGAAGAAA